MAETRAPQATEAHYRMLAEVAAGRVVDRPSQTVIGTPMLMVDGQPTAVPRIVFDLEAFGWVWLPAVDPVWQLTDAGRLALEDGGL